MIPDLKEFEQFQGFYPLEEPIQFDGFECVGYFTYHNASVHIGKGYTDTVCVPRTVFKEIEAIINKSRNVRTDNKSVFLFHDLKHFGTENFAINFFDLFARIGKWEHITGYGGRELTLKEENATA